MYSRCLVLEAAAALSLTWFGLRIGGLHWRGVVEFFAWRPGRRAITTDSIALNVARDIARFHEAAARHMPIETSCLERSLVLCWQLRRRGLPAQLQIGARKEEGRFEAHAWVELCGTVITASPSHSLGFTPFKPQIASPETHAT